MLLFEGRISMENFDKGKKENVGDVIGVSGNFFGNATIRVSPLSRGTKLRMPPSFRYWGIQSTGWSSTIFVRFVTLRARYFCWVFVVSSFSIWGPRRAGTGKPRILWFLIVVFVVFLRVESKLAICQCQCLEWSGVEESDLGSTGRLDLLCCLLRGKSVSNLQRRRCEKAKAQTWGDV